MDMVEEGFKRGWDGMEIYSAEEQAGYLRIGIEVQLRSGPYLAGLTRSMVIP